MSEGTNEPRAPQTEPTTPSTPGPSESESTSEQRTVQTRPMTLRTPTLGEEGVVWVRVAPSQVVRTMIVALLTAAVVLGGLYLLWQIRTLIGWFVIALFLAAVLNPPVNWLQRRHRMVKRSIAIVLTYLGVLVVLVLVAGLFAPLVVQELRQLIDFIVSISQAGGLGAYLTDIADQFELGWLADRLNAQLSNLPSELGELAKSFLLSAGALAISAAGFVAALVSILTLTFFMLLGSERLVNGAIRLFPEPQRPLVRGILRQSGGAVFGYVSGNLAISFIAGITTFILLEILGIPDAAALALLVAVLDLIPLVGATLGATVVVVVGFFAAGIWPALILIAFFVVYQQFEGSVLQPMVYSRAVHLNGLTIFLVVLAGGVLLGIPGALLAIPVAEIIRIIVTDLVEHRSRLAREEAAHSVRQDEDEPAVPPSPQAPS